MSLDDKDEFIINNCKITVRDFEDFLKSNEGKFIIQFLEAKAETVLQSATLAIRKNMQNYEIKDDMVIYNFMRDLLDGFRDARGMELCLREIENFFQKLNPQ